VRNPAPMHKLLALSQIHGSHKRPASAASNMNKSSSIMDDVTFIRLPEVKAVTGLSKTSLYALIKEKSFPRLSASDRAQSLG